MICVGSYLMKYRGDIQGALELVLSDAPYGPNVEEAKVRSAPRYCSSAYLEGITSKR